MGFQIRASPWSPPTRGRCRGNLREFPQVGFWQPGQETGAADFFITMTDPSGSLEERLKNYRPEFFGVRPDVLLQLWSLVGTNAATGLSLPPKQP